MPRKPLVRSNWNPYHITARVNNRETFPIDLHLQWEIFTSECRNIRNLYEVEFHSFVMMPNHIHTILTAPDPENNLGNIMRYFMSQVTQRTHRKSGKTGHLFGGPYHWSLIKDSRYYYHALKYVYRNPVRANLCETVQDYSFSTFQGQIGACHLPFPIHFTRSGLEQYLPAEDPLYWLDWLNRPFEAEVEKQIQMGLRKKLFGPRIDQKTKRPDQRLEKDT
jgi:REP element-mobilizing transposase RayT